MKNQLKTYVLLLFILSGMSATAQIKYSLVAKSGLSNNHVLNRAYVYDNEGFIIGDHRLIRDGAIYTYGLMYSIEANIVEPIKNSKISFEQGVGFESKSYYSHPNPKSFPEMSPDKTKYTFNAITFPIKIRYNLNNTFTAFGGVTNILKVKYSNTYGSDRKYNLRAVLGFDATLLKMYTIGCEYGYDITPYTKMTDYDIYYRFDVIAIKLGVLF